MPHALDPYPSPEERDRIFAALVARAGGDLRPYGRSTQGRPLLAARLPQLGSFDADRQPRARVLSTGNIHGVEYVSGQVVLGLLRAVDEMAALKHLRERAEIWLIPCLNPDGYARVWEANGIGDLRALRPNARGVDLNRNFPLPPGAKRTRFPGAGSPRAGARTYRGPAPLSEPETSALCELLADVHMDAATNGHCFMGRLIPPRVKTGVDYRRYRSLCQSFAEHQPHARYRRLASRVFDAYTGEMEDFQHHVHGTWAVCLETFPVGRSFRQHWRAPSLFWRFNPHVPQRWVENDVPGMAGFFHAALDLVQTLRDQAAVDAVTGTAGRVITAP